MKRLTATVPLLLPLPLLLLLLLLIIPNAANSKFVQFENCKCSYKSVNNATLHIKCKPFLEGIGQVATSESLMQDVIDEADKLINDGAIASSLQELKMQFVELQMNIASVNCRLRSRVLKIITRNCIITAINHQLSQSPIFRQAAELNLEFVESELADTAVNDLPFAFQSKQLTSLRLINSTQEQDKQWRITKINLTNFEFEQPLSPTFRIEFDQIKAVSTISIRFLEGQHKVKLRLLEAKELILEGVDLSSTADTTQPLAAVDFFSISLTRCRLPDDDANWLLGNVANVANTLTFTRTDLSDLPLAGRFSLGASFIVRESKLRECNVTKLNGADLKELQVTGTSLSTVPVGWQQLLRGQILPKISRIDFRNNSITTVQQVTGARQHSMDQHFNVQLSGNPLHCDCSLNWLGAESNAIRFVFRNDDPTCSTPPQLKGLKVVEASRQHKLCPTTPGQGPLASRPPASVTEASSDGGEVATAGLGSVSWLWILFAAAVLLLLLCLIAACIVFRCKATGSCVGKSGSDVKYSMAAKHEPADSHRNSDSGLVASRPTNV